MDSVNADELLYPLYLVTIAGTICTVVVHRSPIYGPEQFLYQLCGIH